MPPKRAAKRSRSASNDDAAARRSSSTPTHSTAEEPVAVQPSGRSLADWRVLHDRSVMALPPTAAAVAAVLAKSEKSDGAAATRRVPVAAFDLDDTLVRYERGSTKTAAPSTAGGDDDGEAWAWVHPSVPTHLQRLSATGHLLVVFTNQSTINGFKGGWNAAKASTVQEKILALANVLGVPLAAYVATRTDRWRKPLPGLWGQLQEDIIDARGGGGGADGLMLDCQTASFYVGDAAGRPAGSGRAKKDFSCGDRRFAYNLALPFYTQTQFFDGFPDSSQLCAGAPAAPPTDESSSPLRLSPQFLASVAEEPFDWGGMSPEDLRAIPSSYAGLAVSSLVPGAADAAATTITLPSQAPFFAPSPPLRSGGQEMVILVGPPAVGKSTFYRHHLQPLGYAQVNRDTLGTKERCLRAAEQFWRAGRSVVIDNTNPTAADRKLYCDLVRKLTSAGTSGAPAALPIRMVVFTHTRSLAVHLGEMRARLGQAARLPDVAFHAFFARFQQVTPAELQATGAQSALLLPPVFSFDGVSPQAKREFYLLS